MINSNKEIATNSIEIRYLNEKKVSMITGKAISTLRNERSRRTGIPYIKAGGKVLYNLQDIIEYMNAHRIDTNQ